jgi:cell division protein ZapA
MSEAIPLTLQLCNRPYRMKVDPEKESMIRKIGQDINQKTAELKAQFPGRDEQDYMAMTLLSYITALQQEPVTTNTDDTDLIEILQTLHTLIDE